MTTLFSWLWGTSEQTPLNDAIKPLLDETNILSESLVVTSQPTSLMDVKDVLVGYTGQTALVSERTHTYCGSTGCMYDGSTGCNPPKSISCGSTGFNVDPLLYGSCGSTGFNVDPLSCGSTGFNVDPLSCGSAGYSEFKLRKLKMGADFGVGESIRLRQHTDIVNRLNQTGLPGQQLCEKLVEFNAIMAGSFPLQCLLNETYDGSDIDIFVNSQQPNINQFEQWIESLSTSPVESHLYVIDRDICSYKYKLSQAIINIVRVETADLKNYINTYFDLSFCKTTFDGHQLQSLENDLTLQKVGYVSYHNPARLRRIIGGCTNIDEQMDTYRLNHPNSPCVHLMADPTKYLMGRIDKYQFRGFRVLQPQNVLTSAKANQIYRDEALNLSQLSVIRRLDKMGLNGQVITDKLIEFKGLMAGSFPLQCVLGETYENSDIDIFMRVSQKIPQHQYNLFDNWIYETYGTSSSCHEYIIKGVLNSRKYQITPKICINLINVSDPDLKKFVKDTFDFSFCQVTFDGYKLDCPYPDLTLNKVGFLTNFDGLKERRQHHISQTEFSQYKLKNPEGNRYTQSHVYPDVKQRYQWRSKKYTDRGFTIISDPSDLYNDQLSLNEIKQLYRQLRITQLNTLTCCEEKKSASSDNEVECCEEESASDCCEEEPELEPEFVPVKIKQRPTKTKAIR